MRISTHQNRKTQLRSNGKWPVRFRRCFDVARIEWRPRTLARLRDENAKRKCVWRLRHDVHRRRAPRVIRGAAHLALDLLDEQQAEAILIYCEERLEE